MKFLVSLCLCIVLFSCNKEIKPPKPDNLIAKDKMVSILVDLTIFNSAKGTNKTILENHGLNTESYIYERHNVDSVQFKKSNDYYSYDLDIYNDIYSKVEDSLNKLKQKYTEERDSKKEERKKQDSLKREQKRKSKPKILNDSIITKKPKKTEVLPEVF